MYTLAGVAAAPTVLSTRVEIRASSSTACWLTCIALDFQFSLGQKEMKAASSYRSVANSAVVYINA